MRKLTHDRTGGFDKTTPFVVIVDGVRDTDGNPKGRLLLTAPSNASPVVPAPAESWDGVRSRALAREAGHCCGVRWLGP